MENTITVREIKNATLRKATERITARIHAIARNAYTIAAILAKIDETECYTEDGFKNVAEYAEALFGMKKSTTYEYIKIGRYYVANNESNLPHEDVDFTHKQVAALLPLKNRDRAVELIEDGTITVDTPVSKIKKIVKAETKAEQTEETEPTEEAEPTEETPDNTALITSAIYDMRAAFSNLCNTVNIADSIDIANAEMLTELVDDIDRYYKTVMLK